MSRTRVREHYEWSEWVELASQKHKGQSHAYRGDFCRETMAEALERATGAGFWEALPEAEAFAARVEAEVDLTTSQVTFSSRYDVAGAEVDMGRFLSGEPECMIESVPFQVARQGRAVRVVVPGCYNGETSIQSVRNRGAAVVALCLTLSRAQHPVEVWVGFANHGKSGARYAYMVRVQKANEPLDEGRIMYALAHETSNRRLCFSVKEQGDATTREDLRITATGGGYGTIPRYVELADLPDEQANTIILEDFDQQSDWSERAAVAWLNRTITELFES